MEKKHYYLKDNRIWMAKGKMSVESDADTLRDYKYMYENWLSSLQPCEISESELE